MLIKLNEDPGMVVEKPWEHWCAPDVAQEYDSRRFHHLRGYLYRWREERAFKLALQGLRPGSRVLDVACGTGRITSLLLRSGFRATGCDISRAMMNVARRQLTSAGHDIAFVENNAEQLPYRDKSFDAVTCSGLFMHLDQGSRRRVLREMARVSRGRLVIHYGCLNAILRLRGRVTGRPPGNVRHPIPEGEMREDVQRAGLTERARFWVLPGFSISLIVRLTE